MLREGGVRDITEVSNIYLDAMAEHDFFYVAVVTIDVN